MPTVNRLSERGYVFVNMWAQASDSNYADIAALSGQHPLRSTNIHFYPRNPGYPRARPYDVLGPLGYASGLFSSQNETWGLMDNYLEGEHLSRFSRVGEESERKTRPLSRDNTGVQVRTRADGSVPLGYDGFMYRRTGAGIERLDEITTDRALEWLRSLEPERPFFLYFNYRTSHYPFNALPEGYERAFLTDETETAEKVRAGDTGGAATELVEKAYKDALRYVDRNIARLVDHPKDTGRHERTVYVTAADTATDGRSSTTTTPARTCCARSTGTARLTSRRSPNGSAWP